MAIHVIVVHNQINTLGSRVHIHQVGDKPESIVREDGISDVRCIQPWRVEKDRGAFISRAENPLRSSDTCANNHMWQAQTPASRVPGILSDIEQNHMMEPQVSISVGVLSV